MSACDAARRGPGRQGHYPSSLDDAVIPAATLSDTALDKQSSRGAFSRLNMRSYSAIATDLRDRSMIADWIEKPDAEITEPGLVMGWIRLRTAASQARRLRREADKARDRRDWLIAEAAYGRYLDLRPNDWAIWVQRGHAQKESGDVNSAEASYRRALDMAPHVADTLLQLGIVLRMSNRPREAADCFRESAALGNEHAANALRLIEADMASPLPPPGTGPHDLSLTRRLAHRNHYRVMFADRPRQVWIGTETVDNAVTLDLHSRPNFRAPASFHNQFDVVWLFESLLSDMPDSQWPLLVDEAIRLIGEEGKLIVRHDQNDNISLMSLRSFLGRRPGISVTMEPHLIEDNCIINAVFTIQRTQLHHYRDNSWSFIILAQGARTPTVIAFLDKLRAIGGEVPHEVIIVGPRLEEYSGYNVFVLDKPYRDDYAQIALKKNDAAGFAHYANLCVMHDRYVLDDNFFSGFSKFGYDFDFVAVHQRYLGGEPFPFYGELKKTAMIWSAPVHSVTYQHNRRTHFVNGGFMVFKRVMFDTIPFNPLLAWNEAEDVEISYAFASRNLPPRINLYSTAITTVSTAHTAVFEPDPSASPPAPVSS